MLFGKQLKAMREYQSALGEGGKASLALVEKADAAVRSAQTCVTRTLGAARILQNAMDGYDGLPTEAQDRQVEWSGEDATADVMAINRISSKTMPGVYGALSTTVEWRLACDNPGSVGKWFASRSQAWQACAEEGSA